MSDTCEAPAGNGNGEGPAWGSRLLDTYEAGVAHSFVLHFNTGDYVSPESPISLTTYLSGLLSGRQVVAVYSRDRGITFPTETMRQKAVDILGLAAQEEGPSDPALAALRAVGAAPSDQDQELPRSPSEALPLLDRLLRANDDEGKVSAVIVEGAELIVPDADLATMSADDRTALATIARWGRDLEIVGAGNPVFLITGNLAALHRDLRAASNRYEAIEVPLPDTDARRRFIQRYLAERSGFELDDGLTVETVANATAGLSLLHVEDILLRAEAAGVLTRDFIWDRKQSIIRTEFGDVLEVIEPRFGFEDIGGLQHIKDFFTRSVIRPIREASSQAASAELCVEVSARGRRKSRVPQGVLMTGPAGCGKSIMAEAVAKEAGINAVHLRIGGQIASKWQGEGERNLEKALRAIQGLAPTIIWIDEIDQAMQRGGQGAGTQQDRRIFQRLLEFMSDTGHRGEIVFLGATNRPDLMDAALRRPGRFDKKVPFLVPDRAERDAIFRVMARRYLGQEELETPGEALDATEGWTGAEIEAAVVKAVELVEDEGLDPIQAIRQAVERLNPSTADIELMTYLSVAECNDRDLLPPKYRQMLDDRAALDEKVDQAREGLGRRRREL